MVLLLLIITKFFPNDLHHPRAALHFNSSTLSKTPAETAGSVRHVVCLFTPSLMLLPNDTAWWLRHMRLSGLPRDLLDSAEGLICWSRVIDVTRYQQTWLLQLSSACQSTVPYRGRCRHFEKLGQKTMYQPRRHLSQMHTMNYMPFVR